jgi:hypothetical protein
VEFFLQERGSGVFIFVAHVFIYFFPFYTHRVSQENTFKIFFLLVFPEVSTQKRWLSPLQFEIVKKTLVFRQQKGRSFDRSVFSWWELRLLPMFPASRNRESPKDRPLVHTLGPFSITYGRSFFDGDLLSTKKEPFSRAEAYVGVSNRSQAFYFDRIYNYM